MSRKKMEKLVDQAIPPALVLLLIIIIAEIFFHDEVKPYSLYIEIADMLVIALFVVDLAFKYHRLPKPRPFVKKYWLDILAVFPFYLAFRLIEIVAAFGKMERYFHLVQDILHGGVETERIAARGEKFTKFLKPLMRTPRFLKAAGFFKEP
ncbi:hypothetical protein ACFLQ2_03205 [archaeon]